MCAMLRSLMVRHDNGNKKPAGKQRAGFLFWRVAGQRVIGR